jgi:hypothetical protein
LLSNDCQAAKAGKSGSLAELNASVNLLASINAPQKLLLIRMPSWLVWFPIQFSYWLLDTNVAESVIGNLKENNALLDIEQSISLFYLKFCIINLLDILVGAHTTASKEFILNAITSKKIPPGKIIRYFIRDFFCR